MPAEKNPTFKPLFVALVRVQGLVVLLYGAVSSTYLPAYLHDYKASLPNPDAHGAAYTALVASLLRLALYLAGGLFLFSRAEGLVSRFSAPNPEAAESLPDDGSGEGPNA